MIYVHHQIIEYLYLIAGRRTIYPNLIQRSDCDHLITQARNASAYHLQEGCR
jgi:hypothetical protein